MRETHFINQNKQKWDDFERMLNRNDSDPEKMSELFVQVTDDLSYSRTFYPNRSVRVYLNNVAQSIFLSLYKNKKGKRGRLVEFWTDELPKILFESRRALQLSLLVFLLFMGVGMLSSYNDPDFAEQILGKGYIQMTDENIAKGDPMGVYKDEAEDTMFLRITVNNIQVSFITFIMGVLASIGTILVIIKNAIMVGAFQQYFINQGLFTEMFFTIWVHGTLEISAIIIAGGAGIVFGSGLIVPGTYSRGQAFILSARKGLKIIIGTIPLFIIAGFIESFLTRYTEAPIILRAGIMLASLIFILFYYVYYPLLKAKKGFSERYARDEIQPNKVVAIDWGKIRGIGEVVAETFTSILPFLGRFALIGTIAGAIYGLMALLLFSNSMNFSFGFSGQLFLVANFVYVLAEVFSLIGDFFKVYNIVDKPLFALVNFGFWATLLTTGLAVTRRMRQNKFNTIGLWSDMAKALRQQWLGIGMYAVVIVGLLSFEVTAWIAAFVPILPVVIGITLIMDEEKLHPIAAMRRTFSTIKGNVSNLIGLYFIIMLLQLLFVSLFCSMLFTFYLESIQLIFDFDTPTIQKVTDLFTCILGGIVFSLYFAVVVSATKLFLSSSNEQNNATELLTKIELLGTKKRVYGFEQEV
jgi:uncharacterized membrane protein SpoIIM required for sporulation